MKINKAKLIVLLICLLLIGAIFGLSFYLLPNDFIFKSEFIEELKKSTAPDVFKLDIIKFKDQNQIGNFSERDVAEKAEWSNYKKISDFDPTLPNSLGQNSIANKLYMRIMLFSGIGFGYLLAILFSAIYGGIIGTIVIAFISSGIIYYLTIYREIPLILNQLKAAYVYTFAVLPNVIGGSTELKLYAEKYCNMAILIRNILTFDWQLKIALFTISALFTSILFDKRMKYYITQLEEKISEAMRYQAENSRLMVTVSDVKKLDEKNRIMSARLTSLQTLTRVISKALDYKDVLKETLKVTQQIINAEKCSIWLIDENTNQLILRESIGWKDEDKESFNSSPVDDVGIVGEALRSGKVMVESEQRGFSFVKEGAMIPSKACAPLKHGEKKIGIINIEKFQDDNKIEQEELRMLELISTLAAVAIENSNLFKKTEMLANTDGLTKLYTRRYMENFLDAELEKSRRYNHPLSFIISDIDHFKSFNDTYGHQIGDFVLEETAKVLKSAVRSVDLAARYGGEEFVAVLPETDYKGAFAFAERYRKLVESKVYEDPKTGQKLKVTISVGVASFPLHSTDRNELIKKADAALYMAKESGRNRVKVAPITKEQAMQLRQMQK